MWPFKKKISEAEVFAQARELLQAAEAAVVSAVSFETKPSVEEHIEEMEREVRELYSEPDGSIPDLTTLERSRSHRFRNFLIWLSVFFGLLAVAAWAGFFIFKPYNSFNQDDFKLTIVAPDSVKSGELVKVTVKYSAAKNSLAKLEIAMKTPSGFELLQAEPAAIEAGRWSLPTLSSSGNGEVVLNGLVRAPTGSLVEFRAFASYTPTDFNSEFQSVGSAAFTVIDSALVLTATSTERAMPGEPVTVVYNYKNTGEREFPGAVLKANLPAGFVLTNSSPASSEGPSYWKLGTIAAGAEGRVTVNGTFDSTAKGDSSFDAELGYVTDSQFARQAATSSVVSVIGGDLAITTIINGSMEASAVNFGDTLRITANYSNRSEATLGNVVLTLKLVGRPIKDGKTVFASSSIIEASKGIVSADSIVWTKNEVPGLAKLAPGDEGSLDITIKLVSAPFVSGAKDYGLDLWLEGAVGTVNNVKKDRQVVSSKFNFPFLSDLKPKAESRYYNDDDVAVGTGPLPPKVGEETTYRIFWSLENALHELENLTMKTTLPANVRFTGKKDLSAGELLYDETNRTVTWTLNKLPTSVAEATADFEVGLTPSSAAAGNILPLTDRVETNAEDVAAKGRIIKIIEGVDTSLVGDQLGRGKGVIQK